MLRLLLVRHGETLWNREWRIQGHQDVPLSPDGVEQARRLARRLASERLTAVWSSDLGRARETAEIIADPHGLQVVATPLLREVNMGQWESLTGEEIMAAHGEEVWLRFRQDSIAHRPPDAEPWESAYARLLEALAAVREAHAEGTVVLVGHGGTLRCILCEALGAPLASMRCIHLDNASLSIVELTPDRTAVRLLNDTGHLRDEG